MRCNGFHVAHSGAIHVQQGTVITGDRWLGGDRQPIQQFPGDVRG